MFKAIMGKMNRKLGRHSDPVRFLSVIMIRNIIALS